MKTRLILSLLLAAAGAQAQSPSDPPPAGEHRGPPAEALTACKTAKAGADCSFTHRGRALTGTCGAPDGRPLACRPKDMPPPPPAGASAPAR